MWQDWLIRLQSPTRHGHFVIWWQFSNNSTGLVSVPLETWSKEFYSGPWFTQIDTHNGKNKFSTFVLLPNHQLVVEFTIIIDKKPIFRLWDFVGWDSKIRKLDFWSRCSQIQPEFGDMTGGQLEKVEFSALITSTFISQALV